MLVDLETQGTGGRFLPALVVGYRVNGIPDGLLVDLTDPAPEWLALLSPQVGGYGIDYPRLIGAVLRLEANGQRGRLPLSPFVHALRVMGESGIGGFEPGFEGLKALFQTDGSPYSPDQLGFLNTLVGRYLDLPPFESGVEALVRTQPADPLSFLADWNVLTYRIREGRKHPYSSTPPPYSVDESNVDDLVTADDLPYRRIHDQLRSLARGPIGARDPAIWLLWENSD